MLGDVFMCPIEVISHRNFQIVLLGHSQMSPEGHGWPRELIRDWLQ